MYKIELTRGPGWNAPPIGRGVSLASRLSFAEVESRARSMLEVAREIAAPVGPDGYRITYEGEISDEKSNDRWMPGPDKYPVADLADPVEASRTFIPAKVDDTRYGSSTAYRESLQTMEEPLRSAMLCALQWLPAGGGVRRR